MGLWQNMLDVLGVSSKKVGHGTLAALLICNTADLLSVHSVKSPV